MQVLEKKVTSIKNWNIPCSHVQQGTFEFFKKVLQFPQPRNGTW